MAIDYGSLRTFGFGSSNFQPKEGMVRVFDTTTFFDIDINLIKQFYPNTKLPYNALYYSGDKNDWGRQRIQALWKGFR